MRRRAQTARRWSAGNLIAGQEMIFIYNFGATLNSMVPPIPQQPPQLDFYVRRMATTQIQVSPIPRRTPSDHPRRHERGEAATSRRQINAPCCRFGSRLCVRRPDREFLHLGIGTSSATLPIPALALSTACPTMRLTIRRERIGRESASHPSAPVKIRVSGFTLRSYRMSMSSSQRSANYTPTLAITPYNGRVVADWLGRLGCSELSGLNEYSGGGTRGHALIRPCCWQAAA